MKEELYNVQGFDILVKAAKQPDNYYYCTARFPNSDNHVIHVEKDMDTGIKRSIEKLLLNGSPEIDKLI
ncbi:hypothetical protein [Cytobacillus oceanisediminis]|uniref:hypothetical protein n=2 Tax=Cytobacillus TaxID=2675230 RepID=UPI00203FB382|nr:hypothetical protein [Cytobacillus oceanisediminis]MCM3394850.1 hypothetical protein [Cytobacillus oceanisediminis]